MPRKQLNARIHETSLVTPEMFFFTQPRTGSLNTTTQWGAPSGIGYEFHGAAPSVSSCSVIPVDCTIDKLRIRNKQATGAGHTITYTVYKSTDNGATWNPTAVVATMTDPATTADSGILSATFATGDLISIAAVMDAGSYSAEGEYGFRVTT